MPAEQKTIAPTDLQEITISRNNQFLEQQNKLKVFSSEIPSEIVLPTASNSSWGSWIGRDRVSSEDVNRLAAKIQSGMIQQNEYIIKIIKEFEIVYNTFSSLDQEYLKEIVKSFNTAVKAHEKANQNILQLDKQQKEIEENQQDIIGIINNQKQIIVVLKNFKEKLEKIRHLIDVDTIFSDVRENQKQINAACQLANKLKVNIEQLSHDVKTKIAQSAQKHDRSFAELKSNIEGYIQRIDGQHKALASTLNDTIKQLHKEINQKLYITLLEACMASQKITWN